MAEHETIEVGDLVETTAPEERTGLELGRRLIVATLEDPRRGNDFTTREGYGLMRAEVKLLARARHIDSEGRPRPDSEWSDGSEITEVHEVLAGLVHSDGFGPRSLRIWFRDFRPVDMAPAAKRDDEEPEDGHAEWVPGNRMTAAQLHDMDIAMFHAINGDNGGTREPAAPLALSGLGMRVDDERVWAVQSGWNVEHCDCSHWVESAHLVHGYWNISFGDAPKRLTRAEADAITARGPGYPVVRHPDCPEPAFPTRDNRTARRVLHPGPDVHDVAPGEHVVLAEPGAYRIRTELGERTYTIDPKQPGVVTLQPEARGALKMGAVYPLTYADPAPPPVQPRPGQRWRVQRDWRGTKAALAAGQLVELLDVNEDGMFHTVRVEGERFSLPTTALKFAASYEDGPTTPETPREALERVLKLEAADVPDGVTSGEWLAYLVNMSEARRESNHTWTARIGGSALCFAPLGMVAGWQLEQVRRLAAEARADVSLVPRMRGRQ